MSESQPSLIKRSVTEAMGTYILVFTGCGAVVTNEISDGAFGHWGISFVFGAVVSAIIYATGHISGAHINPAVTLGLWRTGRFPGRDVPPYIGSQCLGAIFACLTLLLVFDPHDTLGATLPLNDNWLQAFVIEVILTFILMLVVLGAAVDSRAPAGFAGLAVGLTVALEATFMGPITGASMNPARSLGPALVSGNLQFHWVYWCAPILGAQLAVLFYTFIAGDHRAESN
mgnify:CR=1 FL=1